MYTNINTQNKIHFVQSTETRGFYLSTRYTLWLHLGGKSKWVHRKWCEHAPHLLPVSCKWIPTQKSEIHDAFLKGKIRY